MDTLHTGLQAVNDMHLFSQKNCKPKLSKEWTAWVKLHKIIFVSEIRYVSDFPVKLLREYSTVLP